MRKHASTEWQKLKSKATWKARRWHALLLALTVCTLLIHGFHPMAEDGGVYVAGLEYTLNPGLFPHYTDFVREHLRFSVFAPVLAGFVHRTHAPVRLTLLLSDLLTIYATLWGAREILRRCVRAEAAQLAGVALLAAWWTLPVAGTSLLLMDPYVTARSFAMGPVLWAVALALDAWPPGREGAQRGWRARAWAVAGCGVSLLVAALFHPLMAGYGAALVLLVRLSRLRWRWIAWMLAAAGAIGLGATLQATAPPESSAVLAASLSRYYWFLSQWHWFELAGLIGPVLVLPMLLRANTGEDSAYPRTDDFLPPATDLIRAAVILGCIAVVVAGLFAREDASVHAVARIQPLRAFVFLYAVMAALLGARVWGACYRWQIRARTAPARSVAQAATPALLLAMAACMFAVQRATFPLSSHIELPWRTAENRNPWVQAFLWARDHTPTDALFALDAKYVNTDGEDAQTFRAIALRSALPDYSKDGGEASITPALAPAWQGAAAAQARLSALSDAERDRRLLPLGATWAVLSASAPTAHPCPYANETVKVCALVAVAPPGGPGGSAR